MAGRRERHPYQFGGSQTWMLSAGVAILLLLPMIAMHFTDAVDWTGFDFAAAALLLGGGAVAYAMTTRSVRSGRARAVAGAATILIVAVIWAEGAVGIF